MIFKLPFAVALSCAIALPLSAQTFTAENHVKVTPRAGSSFEVAEDRRFGVPGQWCAAADYARRVLRAGWTARIYVQGPGSVRRAVVFGLTPAGAKPQGITSVAASAHTPGANFSVQRAYSYCIQQRIPYDLYR